MAETHPHLCDHPGCKVQIAHVHDEQGRIIWESINWEYLDSLTDSGMKTALGDDLLAFFLAMDGGWTFRERRLPRRRRDLAEETLTRVETERIAAIRERDEAQEAAETYWEAWQDAAVYWKAERDRLRETLRVCGRHTIDCATHWDGTCDCGLCAALEVKENTDG